MSGRDRNLPCHCGSGRKLKKCCASPAIEEARKLAAWRAEVAHREAVKRGDPAALLIEEDRVEQFRRERERGRAALRKVVAIANACGAFTR